MTTYTGNSSANTYDARAINLNDTYVINGMGGNDTLYGGNLADTIDGGTGTDLMVGGNGNDYYYVDVATDVVNETTTGGNDTVNTKFSIDLSSATSNYKNVENLVVNTAVSAFTAIKLTGDGGNNTLTGHGGVDTLIGNAGDDTLYGLAGNDSLVGGDGNDVLNGGVGNDTMDGGIGNDFYYVDSTTDKIVETTTNANGGGVDTIDTTIGLDLTTTALVNIDHVIVDTAVAATTAIKVTGNGLDNKLIGHAGVDTLIGGIGNDTLDGGVGADSMDGGVGDDLYYVDATTDKIAETTTNAAGGGIDTINTTVSLDLNGTTLVNIDNAIVNAGVAAATAISLTGNGLANSLTGHAGVDTLIGNAGNDTLNGGLGADNMAGGADNDTYYVDNAGDVVTEVAGNGTADTVYSSVSFDLKKAGDVEVLNLINDPANPSVNLNINATGNDLNNGIAGNNGNNIIDGGKGADKMIGGGGNDTYYVDNVGDSVFEFAGGGTDTVNASVSFDLSGSDIETLNLINDPANPNVNLNINATGNDLNNGIAGNNGNNIIDGGKGADKMIGGGGDDTYYVDNAGDSVFEFAGGGTDTVNASVSFDLSGSDIETLNLINDRANPNVNLNINATGNDLNNGIAGNNGNNTIDGGKGADKMIGGGGDDTYIVDNDGDSVFEFAGGGNDTVLTSVSYDINGSDIETLALTGSGSIDAYGNELDNYILGNNNSNTIDGGQGDDVIFSGLGDDIVYGGEGDDSINGSWGHNTLSGDAGNDTIIGGADSDVIDGGIGDDVMAGGAGDDYYFVDSDMDAVTETDAAGNDTGGIDTVYSALANYALDTNVENFVFTGAGDAGIIKGNILANQIIGGDGDDLFNGLAGDDSIYAGAGDDVLAGGIGNDLLDGGDGADNYFESGSFGADTISEYSIDGSQDTASFGSVTTDKLWFSHDLSTNDLVVTVIGTANSLTVANWYAGSEYQVEAFTASVAGSPALKTLDASKVQLLVDAMSTLTPPPAGQTTLNTQQHAALDNLIAQNWQ
jgi:Ca2+-binding RTX toxin-like protein